MSCWRRCPRSPALAPEHRERSPAAPRNRVFERRRADHARGRARGRLLRDPRRARWRSRPTCRGRGARDHRDAARRRAARLVVAGPALPDGVRCALDRTDARDRLRRRLPARQVRGRPRARLRPAASCSSGVFVERLQATRPAAARRLREAPATAPDRSAAMVPAVPRRATSSARPRDTWTLRLEPADARGADALRARASSRCSTRSASARRRSRSAASAATARSCTRSAPSAR